MTPASPISSGLLPFGIALGVAALLLLLTRTVIGLGRAQQTAAGLWSVRGWPRRSVQSLFLMRDLTFDRHEMSMTSLTFSSSDVHLRRIRSLNNAYGLEIQTPYGILEFWPARGGRHLHATLRELGWRYQ